MPIDNISPSGFRGRDWARLMRDLGFTLRRRTNHTDLYEHPEYGLFGVIIDRGTNYKPSTNKAMFATLKRTLRQGAHHG